MKLLRNLLFIILGLLVLILLGGYFYVQSDAPDYDAGTFTLSGLDQPADIWFDDYGIPHIFAQTEEDAYYSLGYVHASERLFQMEMLRRVATGRLSEVIGPEVLEVDLLFRTLGLHEISKQSVPAYLQGDQTYQQAAKAYLAGINAFVAEGDDPLEFAILGIEKTPFTLENLYDVSGYMAYTFANGMEQEPIVERIARYYGEAYLQELALEYQAGTQRIHSYHPQDLRLPQAPSMAVQVDRILGKLPVAPWFGSNAWVLGPKRSSSGQVLFANDPHIGYSQPAVWYEAHFEAPGHAFYGYHLAGFPFAPVGHNRHHAVGLTMFLNDDTHFYRERLNPENPQQVWFKDHWEDISLREETIRIKGRADTVIQVRSTRHGPIINDIFSGIDEEEPIALWWIYLQQPNNLMEPAYQLAKASSLAEMQQAASQIVSPGLNVMYGDRDGNIAWWAVGRLIQFGDSVNTFRYLDGASGRDEVLSYRDFSENPQAVNPSWDYVYSANNQPDSLADGYYPGYYAADHRAKRIVAQLESKPTWTAEQVRNLTLDDVGPNLPRLVQYLLADLEDPATDNGWAAKEQLEKWDGSHGAKAIAPTIYYRFLYHTLHLMMADELGEADFQVLVNHYLLQRSLDNLLSHRQSPWWDRQNTPDQQETRREIVNEAFALTLTDLEAQLGSAMKLWHWDQVHYLEHGHPLGAVPPMDALFNVGPIPASSGHEVINNLAFNLDSTGRYRATFGPSRRAVIDFADPEHSWSILPTGNSGHVSSPHYDDQAEMYAKGAFRPQLMNRAEIEAQASGHWLLKPQ